MRVAQQLDRASDRLADGRQGDVGGDPDRQRLADTDACKARPDVAAIRHDVAATRPSASKPEISDAVKAIWGVEVLKVNTLNRKGKVTRGRRSNRSGSKPDTKRALVKLAAGNEIPLFEN